MDSLSSRRRLLLVVIFFIVLFNVTQVGASSVEYIDYTEDFVDNSNDDNFPTHLGTHSVFADLQDYGVNYDQMQEENTGGAGGTTEYKADLFTDDCTEWASEANAYDGDWGTYAENVAFSNGDDYPSAHALDFDSANSGTGTISQLDIVIRMSYASSSASDSWGITLDVGASTGNELRAHDTQPYSLNNLTFTDVTEPNGGGWSWSEVWSAEVHLDGEKVAAPDGDVWNVYEFAFKVTVAGANNYELDLEVGWETADYDESNEYLCIYPVTGGGWPSEDLKVDAWTGSWTNVFSDLTPDQWNNVSIGSYLTDATFEIRFLGGTETGDTIQDTWEIDAVLITTYSLAYSEDVFENIPLSDSSTVSMGASESVYEEIPFYDSASTVLSAVVTIFEHIDLSETVGVGANFAIIVFEILGLAASVVTTVGGGNQYFVTIFEVIGASESITPSMSASVTILETIGFTDITAAYRGFSITVFEIIGLSSSTATSQLTHYYVYEIIGFIESTGVIGGVAATPTTGSMFYQLFFSLDMWGYIGPLALVIIGYIVASKDKNLGVIWFVLESLVIANYLTLVAETPDYWWHIFILLIGCMSTLMYSIRDRW